MEGGSALGMHFSQNPSFIKYRKVGWKNNTHSLLQFQSRKLALISKNLCVMWCMAFSSVSLFIGKWHFILLIPKAKLDVFKVEKKMSGKGTGKVGRGGSRGAAQVGAPEFIVLSQTGEGGSSPQRPCWMPVPRTRGPVTAVAFEMEMPLLLERGWFSEMDGWCSGQGVSLGEVSNLKWGEVLSPGVMYLLLCCGLVEEQVGENTFKSGDIGLKYSKEEN